MRINRIAIESKLVASSQWPSLDYSYLSAFFWSPSDSDMRNVEGNFSMR